MNCKQGDIAIVIRSTMGNEGKIVQCIRYIPEYQGSADWWELDVISPEGKPYGIKDSWLKPIRGEDGPDQSLNWIPVPKPIGACHV